MTTSTKKRKLDSVEGHSVDKRLKLAPDPGPLAVTAAPEPATVAQGTELERTEQGGAKPGITSQPTSTDRATRQKPRINKLKPPRPFPTVPISVSATGPRSAHKEGKNMICVTRKTTLGAYMRRCKDVIIKDGYKTLHLSAMGAAIPLLLQLSCALPPILPFSRDEVHMHVTTSTVEVHDEVLPDDDDEDITYRTRGKSTLSVIIKIGDGEFEGDRNGPLKRKDALNSGNVSTRPAAEKGGLAKGKDKDKQRIDQRQVIFQEPEQELVDMI